jgi:hypothetical protein
MILGQMHCIGQSFSFWQDKITLERAMLVLDHIFTPFSVSTHAWVRGNRSRTSICRNTVESHGGRLPAQNIPVLEAIFIIHLPVKTERPQGECSYLKNFHTPPVWRYGGGPVT